MSGLLQRQVQAIPLDLAFCESSSLDSHFCTNSLSTSYNYNNNENAIQLYGAFSLKV
jgi:hypothetical protein